MLKQAIAVLIFGLSFAASASPNGDCEWIYEVYTSCGHPFTYENGVFHFQSALGKKDVVCSDGQALDFYDRFDNMDIASILSIPYETGDRPRPEVRKNFDPGRLRSIDLLGAVFGGSEEDVSRNLVVVKFLNQKVKFQSHLGASVALGRVSDELMDEMKSDPQLAAFLKPFITGKVKAGTFNWRKVAGTNHLSEHSFGVAIDLLLDKGPQYWLWDAKKMDPKRAAQGELGFRTYHFVAPSKPLMPQKVVDAFERNGFIWGGKWNHYDTMHFEYRPELFPDARVPACGVAPLRTR